MASLVGPENGLHRLIKSATMRNLKLERLVRLLCKRTSQIFEKALAVKQESCTTGN
jgi:hypothetical protein